MDFRERLQRGVVVFDGAMGTQIQGLELPGDVWQGAEGCNEVLNLTAPEQIQAIHTAYLEAGADVVETNTFGGSALTLAEYTLDDRTEAINRAAAQAARQAVEAQSGDRPRFVAGSMGPGTKLPSLGQIDFDSLHTAYRRQASGLIEGGVDLLLIETCQDPLQIKAALLAARDALEAAGADLPIAVSVTVESNGTLLVGTEIEAVLATMGALGVDLLGMNCATGPEAMRPYVNRICQSFTGPVLVQPNAGLPQNVDGEVVYPLQPDELATALAEMIAQEGVGLVGGCCGTTPTHIDALYRAVKELQPGPRTPHAEPSVASLFRAQTLHQDPAPFFVGERTNANGSKRFRKHLLASDWDGVVSVAREQERGGAHGLDLCVAYTGRDELADMDQAARRIATQNTLPLFIDSTDSAVIEAALKLYGGRPVINSINLEAGEARAEAVARLAKRYGAALIALTIDEEGMALEVERKLEVARRLFEIAVERVGLKPEDLIIDALTFTLGSGDKTLCTAGANTLEAIRRIKAELGGVHTLLGVSNISFGLSPATREVLNSVFLAEAVEAGLDLAIVNATKIMPLFKIDPDDRAKAVDLVHNHGDAPLTAIIEHFADRSGTRQAVEQLEDLPLDERIQRHVVDGNRTGLAPLLDEKLGQARAVEIVNQLLIPAMRRVGELFGAGEMQLPFVLQAAEVMKHAVDQLEPHMERSEQSAKTRMVIATVRGDVHDIGKNLVDIILSNNGFEVHNLGINCEIDTMLKKAAEVGADVIGMSGLLVKSTVVMKENLEEMKRRSADIPVLLGGAALTPAYVDDTCAPILESPVVYCTDAFAGLSAMEQLQAGTLAEVTEAQRTRRRSRPRPRRATPAPDLTPIDHDVAIPSPPFFGDRLVEEIDLDAAYALLNEEVLFRGRWGFRRGKLSKADFERQIETEVRPLLAELKQRCQREQILEPKVIYGYYPCASAGEQLTIYRPDDGEPWLQLGFPRQRRPPHRCIADFFLPDTAEQRDLIALQVVTVGPRAEAVESELYQGAHYRDYLLLHGLSVEVAEALAEHWHRVVRQELGIDEQEGADVGALVHQKYRGSRYSFGYPACPDLEQDAKLFEILRPERIGVTRTESGQMVPEQTTSAFVVHHPQAKYFSLD